MSERPQLPEHVTMPLLDVLTRNSLDQDYQHVADARASGSTPSAGPTQHRRAAIVIGIFGLLIVTAAVQSNAAADTNERTREELIEQILIRRDQLADLTRDISRQRDENDRLRDARDRVARTERAAAADVLALAGVTGYAPVRGEGVTIFVDNPPNADPRDQVQDEDLATLVDGLWSAGAEAVSVNGLRVAANSGIRTAGSAINIANVGIRPPYTVLAIGDIDRLQSDFVLTSSGTRWVNLARTLDWTFEMDNTQSLSLPAARLPQLGWAKEADVDPTTKEVAP
jgi:uncharacterized protein YlxW (UPF0749 family)